MQDPLSTLSAVSSRYGPTVAGLLIGTAAKYGLSLTEGAKLTWRGVLADVLLLGMLGLLAIAIADSFHLTGDARVLTGALAAVSSDRLVRLARDRFMRKIEAEGDLAAGIKATEGMAEVPAGPAAGASTATLTTFRSADPRAAGVEKLGQGPLPKNGAEFEQLLGAVDAATATPGVKP